mgnify:CR=1 FL=1
MITRAIMHGVVGTTALLVVYFSVVSLISGWQFVPDQFGSFWYFVVSLTMGFGIQVGLYSYLRNAVHRQSGTGVVAVSGTTSTVAMISCCAHYLANLLPIIGISGALSIIGQYQIELFWIGLIANAAGIIYIASRIIKFSKQ